MPSSFKVARALRKSTFSALSTYTSTRRDFNRERYFLDVRRVVNITISAGPSLRNCESALIFASVTIPTLTGFGGSPPATRSARNTSDLTVNLGSSSRRVLPPTIIASVLARNWSTRSLSCWDEIAAPLRSKVSILPSAVIAILIKTKGRFIIQLYYYTLKKVMVVL